MVSKDPTVILDVSHNYSGFKASINFISGISDIGNRALLLGLLDDKEYKQIVRLLSKYFRKVFLTEPAHERAIPVSTLSQEFLKHGIQTVSESSIIPAYQKALKDINKNEQLFVMGSHFIVGEILKVIKKKNLTR
jgi:dihydrofolate synthase/folylpolyglutamate synthase